MTQLTDIDKIKESPTPEVLIDKQAQAEIKDWIKHRGEQDGRHGIKLDNHLFNIACIALWIFFVLFMILVVIWFIHIILPAECHWLKQPELQAIERILFASALVSLAGKYFSKFRLLDRHD